MKNCLFILLRNVCLAILFVGCSSLNEINDMDGCGKGYGAPSRTLSNEFIEPSGILNNTISGQIFDRKTKKAISYVNVLFVNRETEKKHLAYTDEDGVFELEIPYGNFEFYVVYPGYSELRENITFNSGEARFLKIGLCPEGN